MQLEVEQVWGGYGGEDVVRGVSCQGDRGEILCLLGPNGCGKTTLFRMMLGLLPVGRGEIRLGGKPLSTLSPQKRAGEIAYIPQQHTPIFSYAVLDVVLMGRGARLSPFAAPGPGDRRAAMAALERLGLGHLAHRPYTALSGGQRQLVLIARALCQDAPVLVLDEPAANLDYANQQRVMELLRGLAREGYTVIMSTHSPEHPATIGHRALLMAQGQVVAFGPPVQVLTPEHLEQVYGIPMDVITVTDRLGGTRTLCLPLQAPERPDHAQSESGL